MAIQYTSDGWYIVRVDTGIGEQYATVNVVDPNPLPSNYNPLDGLSSHYKALVSGPSVTAEASWTSWRASLPIGGVFA